MSIKIRPACLGDIAELTALTLRSKQSNGYDDDFMRACKDELTVTPEAISAPAYWVAHQGDVLCGCANLILESKTATGTVDSFFIDPDWQRQGVGRLLWAKIMAVAAENKLVKLRLDADPNAVPFYQAMGFEVVGEVPSGSIKGRMLPRMEIGLSKS
jgi:GNAT superfamily N-acetyltransferase